MADPVPTTQAPRIAIKFGTSSSSASSSKHTNSDKKPGQFQPSSTLGKRQRSRPHALGHDSDSEEDDGINGRKEAITSLGDDSFQNDSKRRAGETHKRGTGQAPFVIGGHKNRDWKADLKTQKDTRHTPSRDTRSGESNKETDSADQDKQIKWGLTITKKSPGEGTQRSDTGASNVHATPASEVAGQTAAPSSPQPADGHNDKEAMDALLGKRNPAKDLIIHDASADRKPSSLSEHDAYNQRMREAAEVSTVEEYSEIPEGEFGAAMLRGMGWDGKDSGPKPKEVKRRTARLGLGAKEDKEIKEAELAKKHGHRERRPRLDEYRRDREKDRQDREGRYRDSYKSQRDRERHGHASDGRHRDGGSHRHRARDYRS
ncbi:DExH-box splicing factor binding site-domain-containing protein [Xylariomycetidae sp. FL0641]|nr:DExH-box splicing factor binding site-domain-containing protein [Xylariomycetidae sp. FL0641]